MKYLIEKFYDKISQFGDGECEFNTRDVEKICRELERLKRKKKNQFKNLSVRNQGIHFHRISENLENKKSGWNNPEKSFFKHWGEFKPEHLSGLLSSDNSGIEIKCDHKARVIAATLMQWLGTNVGMCFIEMALKDEGFKIVKIEDNANL